MYPRNAGYFERGELEYDHGNFSLWHTLRLLLIDVIMTEETSITRRQSEDFSYFPSLAHITYYFKI